MNCPGSAGSIPGPRVGPNFLSTRTSAVLVHRDAIALLPLALAAPMAIAAGARNRCGYPGSAS